MKYPSWRDMNSSMVICYLRLKLNILSYNTLRQDYLISLRIETASVFPKNVLKRNLLLIT